MSTNIAHSRYFRTRNFLMDEFDMDGTNDPLEHEIAQMTRRPTYDASRTVRIINTPMGPREIIINRVPMCNHPGAAACKMCCER